MHVFRILGLIKHHNIKKNKIDLVFYFLFLVKCLIVKGVLFFQKLIHIIPRSLVSIIKLEDRIVIKNKNL